MPTLADLDHIDGYRQLFVDAGFWTPYVHEVCQRHHLTPAEPVRVGIPGTCPVFITGERWIVKFFGRLFDGGDGFRAEREAGRLASLDPAIHTARLVATGELGRAGTPDWPWPYLIFEYLSAVSIGEAWEQVNEEDRLRTAQELGEKVRRLHALPLDGSPVFPNNHAAYLDFLKDQRQGVVERHQQWGSLPAHLIEQIETFLPPLETLVDTHRPPHLIHADLTRDHLLGQFEGRRWISLAIIDFGDARTGDLLYELAALYLDMLNAQPHLLRAFLDAYALPPNQRADLPRKALATVLLHQFNVLENLPVGKTQLGTLDELAQAVWGPAVKG